MRIAIEVPPDVEAGLLAQARAQGLDIPRYVENVLRREAMAHPVAEVFRPAAELTSQERLEHLQKFVESHAGNTVILTDEAMDRESIYGDRGL
jgi:hypothetical protein